MFSHWKWTNHIKIHHHPVQNSSCQPPQLPCQCSIDLTTLEICTATHRDVTGLARSIQTVHAKGWNRSKGTVPDFAVFAAFDEFVPLGNDHVGIYIYIFRYVDVYICI